MRTQWITMQYVAQLGMMAAAGGMGMIQDIWQNSLNKKAEKRGLENSKQLMDYQTMKQLEMWEKTGYGAQMEQLRKAGLNPGLLYGMSGGGGQSTGSVGATAQGIPTQSNLGGAAGMGIQMGMMEAQRKLLESQTNLNNVEAAKKGGPDTGQVTAQTENIQQETDNKRMQYQLMKIDQSIKEIERFEKQDTQDDRLDAIEYNTKVIAKQLSIIENDAEISEATKANKIKLVAIDVITAGLKNAAISAGITMTEAQTAQLTKEVEMMVEKNKQAWQGLDQTTQRIAIEKALQELKVVETWGRLGVEAGRAALDKILPNLFRQLKMK